MTGLIDQLFGRRAGKFAEPRPRIDLTAESYTAIYALSDIHGCYDALIEAERHIVADACTIPGRKLLMFLGDYVDRGPRSSDVLQHLCEPPPAGFDRYILCGNHDDVFLKFLEDPRANAHWLEFGALQTLASYGVDAEYLLLQEGRSIEELRETVLRAIPSAHIDLLRSLPIAIILGPLLFVHAGIRPAIPLDQQTDEDLIWIRDPFLSEGPQLPMLVVHGHTPVAQPVFGNHRIGIDTAAAMGGSLTVLKIAGGEYTILTQAFERSR
ncbi:metallophosphoesterase [Rhizobium sp. BR 362]|uniref:metallophosphoesterase n=1 Tax=Rhizobium sp. BR 362 TaxID=3040670 RepID=UPI002F3F752D